MAEHHLSLAFVYQGWESYQQHLVTAIAALSPDQFALRASPQLRPIGEQVAHIIATRAKWFFLDLREDRAELEDLCTWDGWNAQTGWDGPAPPERTPAELVSGLQTTWQVMQDALARWTVADLEQIFPPTFPGEDSFTRQFVLWHLIEHDLHHGGELSFVLGMHGLTGITI
jgi:uncharacterized damage-inducible protein DinB